MLQINNLIDIHHTSYIIHYSLFITSANFHPFVLPFCLGAIILFAILIYKYTSWFLGFYKEDKNKVFKGIFSFKIFSATKEVFMESLLHRKIFRVNKMLGFMHTSLAFGWFLLIVVGAIESINFNSATREMPYDAIFFNYFNHDVSKSVSENIFIFLMDFILLTILVGVVLAFTKRFYSKLFGMKKTTNLRTIDKLALYSLWCIFPFRFLAESFTSGLYGNGGFLTGSAGSFFSMFLPLNFLETPIWWAYSLALAVFFVTLPYSRYMHIITEVLLIFFRNFGVKTEKDYTSFSEIEVQSCPRCGICINKCPLSTSAKINDVQSVYFIKSVRQNEVKTDIAANCLLCGKCGEYCPVGINLNGIRISQRKFITNYKNNYQYIESSTKKADVIYFAGCMTHLTPTIKNAMKEIFSKANVNYWFMDESGTVCCGRPQMIAGNYDSATQLKEHNINDILNSGAKTLVTSCPICYKMFKEEYKLPINVLHHSQYLLQLADEKKINLKNINKNLVYHDPCELGRGSEIYDEPRTLLKKFATLKESANEKHDSLCCGGSLGNTQITYSQRDSIRIDTLKSLQINNPENIITSCPLCKKSLNKKSEAKVMDLAEVFVEAMN